MVFPTRSLSPQESRVVLALSERGRRETTRAEIVELLGVTPKAADHVIESLRRKGWFERATWGEYLLIPPEQGPDALGDSNLLALASRITNRYYFGFGTAAAHYGLTTQHRLAMMEAFAQPFHGIQFAIPDESYYETEDTLSWGVNPIYAHDWNRGGAGEMKLQISRRETPTLPTVHLPHIEQG